MRGSSLSVSPSVSVSQSVGPRSVKSRCRPPFLPLLSHSGPSPHSSQDFFLPPTPELIKYQPDHFIFFPLQPDLISRRSRTPREFYLILPFVCSSRTEKTLTCPQSLSHCLTAARRALYSLLYTCCPHLRLSPYHWQSLARVTPAPTPPRGLPNRPSQFVRAASLLPDHAVVGQLCITVLGKHRITSKHNIVAYFRAGNRSQLVAMPLHQRSSVASSSKRTSTAGHSSSSYGRHLPHSSADRAHEVDEFDYEYGYDSKLLDDLNKANAALNKISADKDKLKAALDAANRKLNENVVSYRELKAQLEGTRSEAEVLKEDTRTLKEENRTLKEETRNAKEELRTLKEENAALKEENRTVKEESRTTKEESRTFKDEIRAFKEDNRTLKDDNRDLKEETHDLKDESRRLAADNQRLTSENERLEFERLDFEHRLIGLRAKHENLTMRFDALNGQAPPSAMTSPMTTPPMTVAIPERPIPERTKTSSSRPSSKASSKTSSKSSSKSATSSSSKKESREPRELREPREPREDRHRDRDRDERHREREDRPRNRGDKEKSDAKADKERLSKRFDERPSNGTRGPASFIEGWGPSGRMQAPAPAQSHKGAYSNVPRTPNVVTSGHFSSDSSAFDDEMYEDGAYHPYPIAN